MVGANFSAPENAHFAFEKSPRHKNPLCGKPDIPHCLNVPLDPEVLLPLRVLLVQRADVHDRHGGVVLLPDLLDAWEGAVVGIFCRRFSPPDIDSRFISPSVGGTNAKFMHQNCLHATQGGSKTPLHC